MRRTCPECTITAPSVLDAPNMTRWIKAFKRKTRYPVRVWAIHNHIDANRHRTSGTRELLRITRGQLWFTETGGIVNRWVDGRKITRYNQKNAVRAIRNVFKLAQAQPQADHADLHVQLDRAVGAPPALGLGPGRAEGPDAAVAADVPGAAAPASMTHSATASSAVVAQ